MTNETNVIDTCVSQTRRGARTQAPSPDQACAKWSLAFSALSPRLTFLVIMELVVVFKLPGLPILFMLQLSFLDAGLANELEGSGIFQSLAGLARFSSRLGQHFSLNSCPNDP